MLQYLYQQPRLVRFLASYLCIHFIFFGVLVQPLYAITSGPTQPEVQSFQPMGASDMVDIFSGDFSYNIPMFELPGPNGGYPFNLSYHGGVSMDEEASWIGLGWNLNVGAITRSVRGLPDEFNADAPGTQDKIIKHIDMASQTSYEISGTKSVSTQIAFVSTPKPEPGKKADTTRSPFGGRGKLSATYSLSYSNSAGFNRTNTLGADFAANYTMSIGNNNRSTTFGPSYGKTRSVGTSGGATNTDTYGLDFSINKKSTSDGKTKSGNISLGVTYSESVNSRTGLTRTLGANLSSGRDKLVTKHLKQASINSSFTLERAGQSYPPSMDYKRSGANYSANLHVGTSVNTNVPIPPAPPLGIEFGTSFGQDLAVSVNTDNLAANKIEMKPYGYLYSHLMKTGEQDNALMDVNREKDATVKKETKYIGVPNLTYDSYSLSGQGIGGSFRAFRSDVGFSCDNHVVNTFNGAGVGAGYDYSPNPKSTNDVSLDFNYNHNVTTTKKFDAGNSLDGINKNGANNLLFRAPKFLQKNNKTQSLELDETVYFKLFGENTTQTPNEFEKIGTNFPWHPQITNGLILGNTINIGASTSDVSRLNESKPKKEHRNTYIQPILNSDVVMSMGTSPNNATVLREYQITYVQETRPITTPQPILQNKLLIRGNTNLPAHHIGGFTVTSSDGTRYIYALPVYNIKQVERTYSIQSPAHKYEQFKTVPNQVATIGNTEEAFNSATETSRYPYAYMLTAVLGADYVDAGAVGPSIEDGGYWVKFTYQKTSENYKWRTPFKDAFYNKGLYVSREDDKASYSYGEKEIYYLYKAETQSHVALFETSKRVDGRGVETEDSDDSNAFDNTNLDSYQYKLDKAKLFTRFEYGTGITPSALAKPIVSVNLNQGYSLCKKVDNNINRLSTDPLVQVASGKLTLNSISFFYENSERGTLSPYQFEYGYNPDYDTHKYDRWGTFKEPKNIADYYDFPYTHQEPTYARDKYAGAWCLSTINLPTGSTIKVTYEQDDYAFVQNKEAMQMYEIAGIGKIGNFNYVVNEKDPKIFFKLPANSGTTSLQAYLDQTRQVYYKGMFRLKEGGNSYELLSGWLDAASIEDAGIIGTDRYASVTVKPVDGYHPFALGAWQHMKTVQPSIIYRYDVDKKLNIDVGDFFSLLTNGPNINPNLTKEATDGYNGMCASNYWGNEMAKGKGWIRLNNVVGKKYGGGDRVKRILITDNWQINTGNEDAVYGQVYDYTMQDTEDATKIISSGVATYEPSIGGEENALKYADKQTDKIVSADDNHYFFEGPINETLYPGPSVGYQQVKVQSLVAAYLSKNPAVADLDTYFKGIEKFSSSGEVVHEFYTAKDYPTISGASEITIRQGPFPDPKIPKDNFQKNYYMMAAQGFVIESNDMHGKPKAVTYYGQITTGTDAEKGKIQRQNPVSWVRYIYKNTTRDFKGKNILAPNSTVDVLLNDPKLNNPKAAMATIESRNMGLYYDIFADARMYANESYNYSVGFKMGVGKNSVAPSINLAPPYNGSSEELRVIAFNKVIHRNGILERTQAFDGGATVTTTNHIWGENGEVLVSSVDNNFNDRIYTYNIPAHFVYDLTGFAFYSQGLEPTISLSHIGGTKYRATLIHRTSNNLPNASLFSVGDEFIIKGKQKPDGIIEPINTSWQSQKLIVVKKQDNLMIAPFFGLGFGIVSTILEFEGPQGLSATLAPTTPIDLATLVYRSGKRNLLAAKVGHITVLVENSTRNNRTELEIIKDVLFKRSKPEYCNMGFTLTGCN